MVSILFSSSLSMETFRCSFTVRSSVSTVLVHLRFNGWFAQLETTCHGVSRLRKPSSFVHVLVAAHNGRTLEWVIRYKMVIGVAQGLQYLHEICSCAETESCCMGESLQEAGLCLMHFQCLLDCWYLLLCVQMFHWLMMVHVPVCSASSCPLCMSVSCLATFYEPGMVSVFLLP